MCFACACQSLANAVTRDSAECPIRYTATLERPQHALRAYRAAAVALGRALLLRMQVYKAQWRVQTVAVKMLSNTTAKQMEAFKREALILEDLKDTNIVQVLSLLSAVSSTCFT